MRKAWAVAAITCSVLVGASPNEASAEECTSYTMVASAAEPMSFTILDTDVGTEAYQRLVTYSTGGHAALGMAISAAYNYFDACEYAGVGIADGSGGNGYRPNYTLYIWRTGVSEALARQSVYALIGAAAQPVVTSGDCAIACDGSVQGTTTTTTTVAPTPMTASAPDTTVAPTSDQQVTVDTTPQYVFAQVVRGEYLRGHSDALSASRPVNTNKRVVKVNRAPRKHVVRK